MTYLHPNLPSVNSITQALLFVHDWNVQRKNRTADAKKPRILGILNIVSSLWTLDWNGVLLLWSKILTTELCCNWLIEVKVLGLGLRFLQICKTCMYQSEHSLVALLLLVAFYIFISFTTGSSEILEIFWHALKLFFPILLYMIWEVGGCFGGSGHLKYIYNKQNEVYTNVI